MRLRRGEDYTVLVDHRPAPDVPPGAALDGAHRGRRVRPARPDRPADDAQPRHRRLPREARAVRPQRPARRQHRVAPRPPGGGRRRADRGHRRAARRRAATPASGWPPKRAWTDRASASGAGPSDHAGRRRASARNDYVSRRKLGTSSMSPGISKRAVRPLEVAGAERRRRTAPSDSSRRLQRARALLEAGRDHGHADVIAELLVDDGAEDDVRVLVGGARDDLRRVVDLEQAEVAAAGDVQEDAGGALDARLEQRARDRGAGGLGGAVLARRRADAHQRRAGLAHDRAHVGEVEVDDARAR